MNTQEPFHEQKRILLNLRGHQPKSSAEAKALSGVIHLLDNLEGSPRNSDVQVVVRGGVAAVQVNKPGVTVEVRDYDVEGMAEYEGFWHDENDFPCIRYFIELSDGLSEVTP